ncbi:YlbF family regulator [Halospeciosus flavus]|uniref:YlbF family regulator n=1 Tax=Halospeciosus flavus TaxID=3032283 RepID=A0ABD5Z2G5_9EURY|nr:YlbF family regulator [Halospeciosus flavus]
MSIDADADADADFEGTNDVDELAAQLGEAIADLPEYQRFESVKAEVEADENLQEQINQFQQKQQEFMLARQSGDATQQDVRDLQDAQRDLHSHPVMADYLEAQEELTDRLETLNEAISAPLDVDFGGEAGGCCQD